MSIQVVRQYHYLNNLITLCFALFGNAKNQLYKRCAGIKACDDPIKLEHNGVTQSSLKTSYLIPQNLIPQTSTK